jgi:hypothetical protein
MNWKDLMNINAIIYRVCCAVIVSAKGASRRLNSQFVKAPDSGAYPNRGNRGGSEGLEFQLGLLVKLGLVAPSQRGLTNRSTGPIVACRHLG